MGRERLKQTFSRLKDKGEAALVSYLMVGYPELDFSLQAFLTVVQNGTDILEVGVPFSDPVADGPTIQKAHEGALRNGVRLKDVFHQVSKIRENYPEIPILLMTYYNPVFRTGLEKFCRMAADSGADGLIVPDLPPEESGPLKEHTLRADLSLVLLASPTSTTRRLKLICDTTDDMVYFVSVTGTTGARESLPLERLSQQLKTYRQVCSKPVVVGFGVSKREHASALKDIADGVVVGSALVSLAEDKDLKALASKVREIKEALS
ncbi:tryptophan synthase, alpha subunit [Thermocrinis albus DSM 14484]|uniref:Tryptophan synthase alpha chain n=1 Tax=Thermocrinis albus (strain DSM 14484 / JCM 11386 / HI 11/12) TaxID=638303 RepID=D3SN31_THEAH|nr:tryptophan synthase subunit alpha [Thermocrinis albus]ADC90161.1 tryptophan synthase, alpha subunit [Thermocrinis albus DSM 14484]